MNNITKYTSFLLYLVCCTFALAATDNIEVTKSIPFTNSYYYHFSKDQQMSALIKDFCSMQNISVVVSPTITDVVNGRFNKMDPSEFWHYITQAYGLSWFYDGKILYVYKSSELQTQIFKMDEGGILTMSNIIKNLGFSSSDFSFRSVPSANILIVTAPPKYLETINDLSAKFVAEKISDTTIVKTFPLKYAWAYDMSFTYKDGSITVPGVSTLLQNIVTGNQSPYSMSGMDVNLDSRTAAKRDKMQTLVSQAQNNPFQQNQSSNTSKDSKDSSNNNSSEDSTKPTTTSSLPGFITCDQRLNAVIIRDRYENMQFYEDIIKQLDVPCEVIKIDVAIVDIDKSKGNDIGLVGLGASNNKNILNIGVSSGFEDIMNTSQVSQNANVYGSMKGVVKGYSIFSHLQAMEEHGDAKTIAKPSVLTLDNVGAIIEKGQTMYSKVKGTYSEGLYDISASTTLQVVPHIIPNDVNKENKRKLKMFVNIKDDSLSGTAQEEATPNCDSNSINTQAVLYEDQCLLIGGYFKDNHTKTASGVPFLQRLPLIGHAFKRTNNTSQVVERIYVISPSVVNLETQDIKYGGFVNGGDLENKGYAVFKGKNKSQKKPKLRH